mgnify:FL=1
MIRGLARSSAWLRAILIALAVGLLALQLLLPVLAGELGSPYDEIAHLVGPYSVLGILALASLQVVLFALWRLAGMAGAHEVFTPAALRWVDVVRLSLGIAALLIAGPMVHLLLVVAVGGPGVVLGLGATLVCGVAAIALVTVMRGLLQEAILDRAELAAVI